MISCFNVYVDVTCVCSYEYVCGRHMVQCGIITMQNNVFMFHTTMQDLSCQFDRICAMIKL